MVRGALGTGQWWREVVTLEEECVMHETVSGTVSKVCIRQRGELRALVGGAGMLHARGTNGIAM